jgi:signal transduction histidine kinase/CheY-like chemotaxis protein/integral membrane sensor domain MASE1
VEYTLSQKITDSIKETYPLNKSWLLYLTLFSSYIVFGHLLSSFSFHGQIVPIWLPAGIALLGCYLWWWRFIPAVFLAAFIFNFSVIPNFDLSLIFSVTGIQNAMIASGATLQAMVGSALLRYWLGNPINQSQNKKTLYFILIVGILVNLLSSTIGVSAFTLFNPEYSVEEFQLNLIYWWLSDSLGVLISLPFMFSLLNFHQLKTEQRNARLIILYAMSALLIIIILLTNFFIAGSNSNDAELITKESNIIENGIYRQIISSIEQLSLLADFAQHNPDASREKFHDFVSKLTQDSNTLKAMSWNPLINQAEKRNHETQLAQYYQKNIAIRGKPLSINDDMVYVKLISPEKENIKAIGFNVYSNPSRKKTLDSTMRNYQPQATPIIQLVQSFKNEPAFLLFFPVFEQTMNAKKTRDKKLIGFATGVFLANKIISNAISEAQEKLFYYEVFEKNKKQSFFANTDTLNKTHDAALNDSKRHFNHDFNVAGQTWNIHLFVNEGYLTRQQHQNFLRFFLLLVIIAVTIVTSLLLMNNRQLQLNNLVSLRTKSLKEAVKEANYANKAKSQFLANMSHEIRTPMNSVIGFAQLAKVSNNIDEIKAYLQNIDISSDLLLHIVNNILDISKIESEKLFLTKDAFDMHLVLDRIYSLFEVEASNKELSWHLRNNLPLGVNFSGDQTRIEQILINLCGNAMKFTQVGGVSITADLDKTFDNIAHITITVKDTGIGISADKIEKLFNPFTQADTSTSRDFGGTGLGLTIAKKLSQLMAGDITIESKVGIGTSFIFTCKLPLTRTKPRVTTLDNHSFQQLTNQQIHSTEDDASSQSEESNDLSKLNVLVAEDNRINQKLIITVLNKLGINAVVVENGQLAVDYVKKETVDVILMDCQMPVLDGYQATQQIRAMPEYADLPIFALTADVDTRSKDKAMSLGFTKHLAKPINLEQLTLCLLEVTKLDTVK